MLDRLKEREERKEKLLLLQKEAEAAVAYGGGPTKPQKQYGLELLKQQLRYDSEMEEQKTEHHLMSENELNYGAGVPRPDTQAK